MKAKIITAVLAIMAVAMYTIAVIEFIQGNVISGIADVLMACTDAIMAWILVRQMIYDRLLSKMGDEFLNIITELRNHILDYLHTTDDDDKSDEIPENELTADEKRIKRMAEEYDQLKDRLNRLQAFLSTDFYEQLPEQRRTLLAEQAQHMTRYAEVLKHRLEMECDTANVKMEEK